MSEYQHSPCDDVFWTLDYVMGSDVRSRQLPAEVSGIMQAIGAKQDDEAARQFVEVLVYGARARGLCYGEAYCMLAAAAKHGFSQYVKWERRQRKLELQRSAA